MPGATCPASQNCIFLFFVNSLFFVKCLPDPPPHPTPDGNSTKSRGCAVVEFVQCRLCCFDSLESGQTARGRCRTTAALVYALDVIQRWQCFVISLFACEPERRLCPLALGKTTLQRTSSWNLVLFTLLRQILEIQMQLKASHMSVIYQVQTSHLHFDLSTSNRDVTRVPDESIPTLFTDVNSGSCKGITTAFSMKRER